MGSVLLLLLGLMVLIPSGVTDQNDSGIIEIASKEQSAVVTIIGTRTMNYQNPFLEINIPREEITEGSGFIIANNGTILTNKHVVEDTDASYRVVTSDGMRYRVKNIIRDPDNDIAVVVIDPTQHAGEMLTMIGLGDSTNLTEGETIGAIVDDPGNISPITESGKINSTNRKIVAGDYESGSAEKLSTIETDLGLIPGNSGSPLIDGSGKVIGINTATSSGPEDASFALPISVAENFLKNQNISY